MSADEQLHPGGGGCESAEAGSPAGSPRAAVAVSSEGRAARAELEALLKAHCTDLAKVEEVARRCCAHDLGTLDFAFNASGEEGASQLSPLELAVQEELNDTVNMLLENELCEVDRVIGLSCTCLCRTCYTHQDNLGLMKILLYHGADPNETVSHDRQSASCLITAVIHGRADVVELLLDYGANIFYEWKGQNALSMAIDFRRFEIQELIEQHEFQRAQQNRIERFQQRLACADSRAAPRDAAAEGDGPRVNSGSAASEGSPEGAVGAGEREGSCGGVDFSRTLEDQSIMSDTFVNDLQEVDWILPGEEVDIGRPLGSGGFGDVYAATLRSSGDRVACKQIACRDARMLAAFKQELRLLSRFRHENIVLFRGAVVQLPRLCIITELMAGNLYDRLHEQHAIPWGLRYRWARDLARGMNYLHSRKPQVIHRDLKSLNALVDEYDKVKLCDFGLSRLREHTVVVTQHIGGSPAWMAPEVLRGEDFNASSDVYSFGVILWELMTRQTPWPEKGMAQLVGLVGFSRRQLDLPDPLPRDCHASFADLAVRCWSEAPERPTFKEMVPELEALADSSGLRR